MALLHWVARVGGHIEIHQRVGTCCARITILIVSVMDLHSSSSSDTPAAAEPLLEAAPTSGTGRGSVFCAPASNLPCPCSPSPLVKSLLMAAIACEFR